MADWSSKVKDFVDDNYSISGTSIPVKRGTIDIMELSFWSENPRIYSEVNIGGAVLDQEEILDVLLNRNHVRELKERIRNDGMVNEPIAVLDKKWHVIEGNSRLAVARFLAGTNPDFSEMKVMVFPSDLSEKHKLRYLAEQHIGGKSDWDPYETAGVIYRGIEKGETLDDLGAITGLGPTKCKRKHGAYKCMLDHGEEDHRRWSYYEVLYSSQKVIAARKNYPLLEKILVQEIQGTSLPPGEKVPKATEFRDKLNAVAKNRTQLKKLATAKSSLTTCHDIVIAQGGLSDVVQRVNKIDALVRELKPKHFQDQPLAATDRMKQKIRKSRSHLRNIQKAVWPDERD